jgi:hypothetical protein
VFGDAIDAVGAGIHRFRDPSLRGEFDAARLPIEVSEAHAYAVDSRRGRVDFFVDGKHVRTLEQAPDYPMQTMIGVFDFPAKAGAAEHAGHVPQLVLDYVRER